MLYKRCACADRARCRHPFWYEFSLYDRRYRQSTRTANRQLADRIAHKHRTQALERHEGLAPAARKPYRLSELIRDYTEVVTTAKQRTLDKSVQVMGSFKDITGDPDVADISAFAINRWKVARAKEVKLSTVNREMNVLRGMFSQAVVWKKLRTHPMADVEDFTVDDQRVRVLSDDELKAVLTCGDEFVTLVCQVTLESLARLSEVITLRTEHVGPTWIEFRRKGGRVTRAAVTPDVREKLLKRAHTSGYLFGERARGKPPTSQTATTRIVRALLRLGIRDASHHTMRHTGVTLMLERGENPRAIQVLAGWSSLRMLERYGHARDASIRQAVSGNAAYLADLLHQTPQSKEQSS